jgi:asparagine synthase (glutamine-hydrolysing)
LFLNYHILNEGEGLNRLIFLLLRQILLSMCGILGFIGKNQILSDSALDSMINSLGHRGPDARGVFRDQNMVLGHLRLSILDLSHHANQPMISHCERYVMVYNGEIYNFREIQKQIEHQKPGFKARTSSDSEIILEAFALWNTAFVQKLNGMFAIAIWDRQLKQLFLFRDRMGIKPIYIYQNNGTFAFSSELKTLVQCPEIKITLSIDYTSVNQFLHLGYIPHPSSIYQQIRKFPAAHTGVYIDGKLHLKCYWDLDEKACSAEKLTSAPEALEQLKILMESSVRYRLISDVPYGTFLSGGIDSSLVTAVAAKLNRGPLNTFSIGFWEKEFNEAPHARKIAQHLGTSHHELTVTERDALDLIPQLNSVYDEPYADSSAVPTMLVSKMARQYVTMTLSGDGGDELFMGYGAYIWAKRLSAPYLPLVRQTAAKLLSLGPMRYKRAAGLFENPGEKHLRSHIFSQEQYLFSRRETQKMLLSPFINDYALDENIPCAGLQFRPEEQQALFDLRYYLPDDLLVKVDRASMHFGLETRVPLLDYRIVEWALKLDTGLKIKDGNAKWILKQVLYEYLPAEFFNRPKRGFAIPLNKWLGNELKPYVMDYLNPNMIHKTGLLQLSEVNRLLHLFYQKGHTHLYNKIWLLVVLQRWLDEIKR